ncbi:MAG: hypothetical protein ABSG86_12015 [Thermoguttaceae bacterium]|jgi:hypothetical protein
MAKRKKRVPEPTREELTNIVPIHVLDEADRLGLNVWRGRHLAVQAGWMTTTGRVTPVGRRLCIEQGWRDEEDFTRRTCDVLEVRKCIPEEHNRVDPGGRLTGWCPLFANPRMIRTWSCPGRGRMQCPMCERYVSVSTARCSCGLHFKPDEVDDDD